MKDKNPLSIKNTNIAFLSFFGVGFFPFAPGTAGTIATLPFLYLLGNYSIPFFFFLPFLTILTIISCFIADMTQKKLNLHDPSWIVIDEVIGMFTAWLFHCGNSTLDIIILFVLFRFFDIVKFWPASYFDKQVKHGAGTILDDVISGLFAGLCYKVIINFL